MRFGNVILLGRPNVGKSTFLNGALGETLAIVSPVPQTTRDALLGVVHRPNAQLAFVDTPGVHRPRSELGRRMNSAAMDALPSADVVIFMTDVQGLAERARRSGAPAENNSADSTDPTHDRLLVPADVKLLDFVSREVPLILAVNKIDLLRDKSLLLPLSQAFHGLRAFQAIVPLSAKRDDDVARVLDVVEPLLPEGPPGYAEDDLTNRPTLFFVREYIREQILLQTGREVPHAAAVTVDKFEASPKLTRIAATIHVEKVGQRKIIVGSSGHGIREIGRGARLRIEALLGGRVHLELFVRVTPRWRNAPRQLAEMGYDIGSGHTPSELADAAPSRPHATGSRRAPRRTP